MKKLLIILALLTTGAGSAFALGKLPPLTRAAFCYPDGYHWVRLRAAFPDKYTVDNAQYLAQYGPTTRYCPLP